MSLENAILEHAGALKELAAAIRESATATREGNAGHRDAVVAYAAASAPTVSAPAGAGVGAANKDAEIEQAVQKLEDDATMTRSIPREELQQAITDAKAESKPADLPKEVVNAAENRTGDEQATQLDYAKHVRPVLLGAIKAAGKEKVAAIVKKFGVEKADEVPESKMGELLAQAETLVPAAALAEIRAKMAA